jgi:Histidine phosphatase superfamily (branch 2)
MEIFGVTLTLTCLQILLVTAETNNNQQILGTVIYTLSGDHTPYVWPENPVLTPLGAQQLFGAGTNFRNRYVLPTTDPSFISDTGILNISPYQLSINDLDIWTTNDQYILASAQAFMQGLYPPLVDSSNYTYITGQSELSNGTNVVAPLGGYQYPLINTVSSLDLNSIWISGSNNCPMQLASASEYFSSPEYFSLEESTTAFYTSLEPILLDGIFINASVGYYDAYFIWDYLNYAAIHNFSAFSFLQPQDLTQARDLAYDWMSALYANTTASGSMPGDQIRAIAGRTFAYRVLDALYTNINTEGEYSKMTLLFGGLETMVSFAALAQISSDGSSGFSNLPDSGSSMVFELFSLFVNDDGSYPDTTNLYVRFLFQNGSSDSSELIGYPLFGLDDSQIIMSFDDFVSGMNNFMVMGIEDWCSICSSYSVFCPAFEDTGPSSPEPSGGSTSKGLHPAIAGVVGAIVTLVVVALIFAAAMLLGGIRLYRRNTKRRSDLNGFKGAEKLASDQDLTIPKSSAGVSVGNVGGVPDRGHERVGSWELRDQTKAEEGQMPSMAAPKFAARRPSYEEDDLHVTPFASPVKTRDQI